MNSLYDHNWASDQFLRISRGLRKYHRHEVYNLDNIPTHGKVILAINHSFATYDIFMLFAAIHDELGRFPRALADRLLFKIPVVTNLVEACGGVKGSPQNAEQLLEQGNIVAVAPGGMREALRPTSQQYELMWSRRKGFVRLAIKSQCPIILAMCPRADDLYSVYPSEVTDWAYRRFRIPLVIARGVGLTGIPRPRRLFHRISQVFAPPPMPSEKNFESVVDEFHAKIVGHADQLMGSAL